MSLMALSRPVGSLVIGWKGTCARGAVGSAAARAVRARLGAASGEAAGPQRPGHVARGGAGACALRGQRRAFGVYGVDYMAKQAASRGLDKAIDLLQRDDVSVPALYLLGDCIEVSVDLGLALPASASQRGTTAVVNVPGDDGEGVTGPEFRGIARFTRDDLAPGGNPSTGEPNEGCHQSRESRSHDYPPPPTHEVHFPLRHRSDKSSAVTWTSVGSGLSAAP